MLAARNNSDSNEYMIAQQCENVVYTPNEIFFPFRKQNCSEFLTNAVAYFMYLKGEIVPLRDFCNYFHMFRTKLTLITTTCFHILDFHFLSSLFCLLSSLFSLLFSLCSLLFSLCSLLCSQQRRAGGTQMRRERRERPETREERRQEKRREKIEERNKL